MIPSTPDDIAYRAAIASRDIAAAQHSHDAARHVTTEDPARVMRRLEAALAQPGHSPRDRRLMQAALDEARAEAGYLPTIMGVAA